MLPKNMLSKIYITSDHINFFFLYLFCLLTTTHNLKLTVTERSSISKVIIVIRSQNQTSD